MSGMPASPQSTRSATASGWGRPPRTATFTRATWMPPSTHDAAPGWVNATVYADAQVPPSRLVSQNAPTPGQTAPPHGGPASMLPELPLEPELPLVPVLPDV